MPLARAVRDLKLDITRPSVDTLLQNYQLLVASERKLVTGQSTSDGQKNVLEASLFPDFLDEAVDVQVNPDGWYYEGFFPWGEWKYDDSND